MVDVTLRQLAHFVAVVEEGSVTAAAQRLHVSAGGVSLALTELEAALQVQLAVRRRGRGVTVTSAGRAVYERAVGVLEGAGGLRDAARALGGRLTGPLRIGCFTTLSPWLLPRVVAHFADRHPDVDVRITEGASAALQQQLRDGALDVCLLYANHTDADMSAEEIAPVRLQVVLRPDHPLARRRVVPLRLLEHEPAILLALPPAGAHVEEIMRAQGLRPMVRWRSANIETIRGMVARGLGYTVIMGRPEGDVTYDGLPLAYRRIADDVPPNAVVLVRARGARETATLRALSALCHREFAAEGVPVQ